MRTRVILQLLIAGAVAATVSAQSPGTFTATGSMMIPRNGHTATLLTSGKVLITGGEVLPTLNVLRTAELYDPLSGTFSNTGNMTTPRIGHTATLLPDGRVLIVGGSPDLSPSHFTEIYFTEIYDPSTGEFSPASDTIFGHVCHQATLLNNGKVLITGGGAGGGLPYGPELYDPTTGVFGSAGTYAYGNSAFGDNTCQGSVASLLPDGRVLMVWEGSTTELYDPDAGLFTSTGKSIGPCYCDGMPTATTLLNGKILIAGGESDAGIYTSADLYDSSAGAFTATANLNTPRVGQKSTLLPDGSVLMDGSDSYYPYPSLTSSEIYDPVSGAFTPTGDMTAPRGNGHTATLLNNGQVLIVGGADTAADSSTAELYHPRVLVTAPVLFSVAGNGQGQGAIWHAATGQVASPQNPASAGEILSMYTTNLAEGGAIPPQVAIGDRLAQIVFFGDAPTYPGYFQVNFRVPTGVTSGPYIPVRLTYLNRPSDQVSIGVQ
jgi:hypothetical protein